MSVGQGMLQALEQQISVCQSRQHVVVGASFQFLPVAFASRDVGQGPGHVGGDAIGAPDGPAAAAEPTQLAGFYRRLKLHPERNAALKVVNRLRPQHLPGLGIQQGREVEKIVPNFIELVAEHLLESRREVPFIIDDIPVPNAVVRAMYRAIKTAIALGNQALREAQFDMMKGFLFSDHRFSTSHDQQGRRKQDNARGENRRIRVIFADAHVERGEGLVFCLANGDNKIVFRQCAVAE